MNTDIFLSCHFSTDHSILCSFSKYIRNNNNNNNNYLLTSKHIKQKQEKGFS
jgi:hypothetical protein